MLSLYILLFSSLDLALPMKKMYEMSWHERNVGKLCFFALFDTRIIGSYIWGLPYLKHQGNQRRFKIWHKSIFICVFTDNLRNFAGVEKSNLKWKKCFDLFSWFFRKEWIKDDLLLYLVQKCSKNTNKRLFFLFK